MSTVRVKATCGDNFRRFHLQTTTSWRELQGQLKSLFGLPSINVRYQDEENDQVALSSEEELQEAYKIVKDTHVLRLIVEPPPQTESVKTSWSHQSNKPLSGVQHYSYLASSVGSLKRQVSAPSLQTQQNDETVPKEQKVSIMRKDGLSVDVLKKAVRDEIKENCCERTPAWFKTEIGRVEERIISGVCEKLGTMYQKELQDPNPTPIIHYNIICDGCNQIIVGTRYKCGNCADFDLCERCESLGVHDLTHAFIKFPLPVGQWVGRNKHGVLKPMLKYNVYDLYTPDYEEIRRKREKKIQKAQLTSERKEKTKERETLKSSDRSKDSREQKPKELKKEEKLKRRIEKMARKNAKESISKLKSELVELEELKGSQLYNAVFVEDCNIADGTRFPPNTKFEKRWIVKNVGTLPWNDDITLTCLWGTVPYVKVLPVAHIQPGEQTILTVHFVSPSESGEYESHWRLDHCGIGFGHCLWCNVVVDDDAIPAATPTAIPSSFQADKNSTETIGSRDLINFDSHELPMSATGKEEMSQMETQLSDESFEAIAAPETGDGTASVEPVDEEIVDQMAELRVKNDLLEVETASVCSANSDSSEFFVVPMPECFDVSKPLPDHVAESTEDVEMTPQDNIVYTATIANLVFGQEDLLKNETKPEDETEVATEMADVMDGQPSVHFPPPYKSPADIADLAEEGMTSPQEASVHNNPEEDSPCASPPQSPQLVYPPNHQFAPPNSQFVLPKPSVPVLKKWQPTPPDSPLGQLIEMGFADRQRNTRLLQKHGNNVQAVVQELLAENDNDWSSTRHY